MHRPAQPERSRPRPPRRQRPRRRSPAAACCPSSGRRRVPPAAGLPAPQRPVRLLPCGRLPRRRPARPRASRRGCGPAPLPFLQRPCGGQLPPLPAWPAVPDGASRPGLQTGRWSCRSPARSAPAAPARPRARCGPPPGSAPALRRASAARCCRRPGRRAGPFPPARSGPLRAPAARQVLPVLPPGQAAASVSG